LRICKFLRFIQNLSKTTSARVCEILLESGSCEVTLIESPGRERFLTIKNARRKVVLLQDDSLIFYINIFGRYGLKLPRQAKRIGKIGGKKLKSRRATAIFYLGFEKNFAGCVRDF
jgi:hypothetical protein